MIGRWTTEYDRSIFNPNLPREDAQGLRHEISIYFPIFDFILI